MNGQARVGVFTFDEFVRDDEAHDLASWIRLSQLQMEVLARIARGEDVALVTDDLGSISVQPVLRIENYNLPALIEPRKDWHIKPRHHNDRAYLKRKKGRS